jgi:ubiquinone/menaquinone biosynthesis C-methylase UbiE
MSMPEIPKVVDRRVNYDKVAPTYDQRYSSGEPAGIATALLDVSRRVKAERALEVGCGTGHWLSVIQPCVPYVCGLDLSLGMLQKAQQQQKAFSLIRGHANQLPFATDTFDIVFCVNALHHFDDPRGFVHDARCLLRQGGALVVVGMNPHSGRDRWSLYDYFPGTYEMDLHRYPSPGTITDWLIAAGFDTVEWRVAERIVETQEGRAILDHPILQRNGTSQLALLTDEEYAAGRARLEAAIAQAETAGEVLTFSADIALALVTGYSLFPGTTKR